MHTFILLASCKLALQFLSGVTCDTGIQPNASLHQAAIPGCKDEDGNNVEYFVAIKGNSTLDYFVIYPDRDLQIGNYDVRHPYSIFARTLAPTFGNPEIDFVNVAAWNDNEDQEDCEDANAEDSEILNASHGHTKGTLAFDGAGGFLLVHSVPRFGYGPTYSFPDSGSRYGQTAVCVSLPPDSVQRNELINSLLDGMYHFKPQVCKRKTAGNLDANIKQKIENLGKGTQPIPVEPERISLELTPRFTVYFFGRHRKPEDPMNMEFDAFNALARYYNTILYAQTWRRSGWPSSYTVKNVANIRVGGKYWSHLQDHSKWAVAETSESYLVCIGDLNRHATTMSRGGMFLCTLNVRLANLFRGFVVNFENMGK